MCNCEGPKTVTQTLDELDFERGIWAAAQYGDVEKLLNLLQRKGCDVNQRDTAGYTALHYAARNGQLKICEILLNAGAKIDAKTRSGQATSLHRAAANGKTEVVKFLLAKGADFTLKDSDGKNVLHRAVQSGSLDTCRLILETGCVELKDALDNRGCKPLDYCQCDSLSTLLL